MAPETRELNPGFLMKPQCYNALRWAVNGRSQHAWAAGCHLKKGSQFILYCSGKQDKDQWVEITGKLIFAAIRGRTFQQLELSNQGTICLVKLMSSLSLKAFALKAEDHFSGMLEERLLHGWREWHLRFIHLKDSVGGAGWHWGRWSITLDIM